ncbi:unnamed protein product [Calypogeia fissa]
MDMHLHGACMGKLVGPTGGAGGVGGGTGISTQFRILPNSMPSECYPVDPEKVPVGSQRPALHLRLSSPTPHRTFSPEPLKIGDEYNHPSGSSSPIPDSIPAGFLLYDTPSAVRRPALPHSSSPASTSPAKLIMDAKFVLDDDGDGLPEVVEPETLMVIN